jgi:hypothetical protein
MFINVLHVQQRTRLDLSQHTTDGPDFSVASVAHFNQAVVLGAGAGLPEVARPCLACKNDHGHEKQTKKCETEMPQVRYRIVGGTDETEIDSKRMGLRGGGGDNNTKEREAEKDEYANALTAICGAVNAGPGICRVRRLADLGPRHTCSDYIHVVTLMRAKSIFGLYTFYFHAVK